MMQLGMSDVSGPEQHNLCAIWVLCMAATPCWRTCLSQLCCDELLDLSQVLHTFHAYFCASVF